MPWTAPPTAPRCPACNTSVFPAEAFMAADRKPFHKQCVKCFKCHKALNPATINEHQSQLFCKACYDGIFMPQEYSTGTYGGIVTPDDIRRREEEEKRRAEKAERAKRERRCPGCDMKVGHTRANMELDLQSLFGLHVHSCTHRLRPPNPPPPIWAHIPGAVGQPR